jgi:DNA-binding response OmpR family regulator
MQNDFSNLTLLYVEDDEIIRQNALEYLSAFFKEVFQSPNGQVALDIYNERKPDIIITDIEMPRLSGLEMAKKIRREDKTTPIIIATAFTDTSYLLQAVELQLIKYMTKPITSKKMREALNIVFEHLNLNNIIKISTDTHYDKLNKTLVIDNNLIKLTKRELQLLDLLAKNYHRMVNYEEIESIIWYNDAMSKDALRALVRTVRKKLGGEYIENISGFGYRLRVN